MNDPNAHILREGTGTSAVAQVAQLVASVLSEHEIPHLIAGGLAVQEHGYPRMTLDVDVIVPDILESRELLTSDLSGPFIHDPEFQDTVRHKPTGIQINLLPGGKVLKRGCRVPFPMPNEVSAGPKLISLQDLISLKLDSWAQSPVRRLRDKTDVIELIARRKLSRDLPVHPAVQKLYQETWDALQNEH